MLAINWWWLPLRRDGRLVNKKYRTIMEKFDLMKLKVMEGKNQYRIEIVSEVNSNVPFEATRKNVRTATREPVE
jgi:hypothetical protein